MPKKIAPVPTRLSVSPYKLRRLIRDTINAKLRHMPRDGNLYAVSQFVTKDLCNELVAASLSFMVGALMAELEVVQSEAQAELGKILGHRQRTIQRMLKRTSG